MLILRLLQLHDPLLDYIRPGRNYKIAPRANKGIFGGSKPPRGSNKSTAARCMKLEYR
jgi:hypothetical protein